MSVIDRVSGLVFSVLLLVAVALTPMTTFVPPSTDAIAFFEERSSGIVTGAYVAGFAAVALIWFATRLVGRISEAEGGTYRLSAVAFAGAVISAGALFIGYMYLAAGAARSGSAEGILGAHATAVLDLSSIMLGNVMTAGFALVVGAAAMVRSVLPRWLVWPTGLMAIGLLTPLQWAVGGLVLIWVPLVSWLMVEREAVYG